MRLSKMCVPYFRSTDVGSVPTRKPSWRIAVAIAMTAGLAACSANETENLGQIGAVSGYFGGVVADEPRAVRNARDVLSAGGTAADAAVALYATMTVTKPSVAGIGGGGVCVVHDRATKKVEVLDFWPRPGTRTGSDQTPTTIPTVPRGLYALSARYGRLQWGSLISAAEQYARLGVPVSRSLVKDIEANRARIEASPALRATFMPDGKMLEVGDRIRAVNLAALLTSLRVKGPGEFYSGALGADIANAVTAAGGTLTADDMRTYRPQWKTATEVKVGNETLYLAYPPRSNSGTSVIAEGGELADILNRYLADIASGSEAAQAGAGRSGFVVVDRAANAVACVTTMNKPFGAGLGADAFGLNLAAGDANMISTPLMGPALMVNPFVWEYYYGIAGTGTPAGATKQIATMAEDLIGAGAASGISMNSDGASSVNVIKCLEGTPPHPESCQFLADPAGGGMAGTR
ncbi:gamma-glutamyltransferase [Thalassospira indica]|uniref:Gamma-glutamyltranspeptidase n=1 Tax=Thalassospira indica TaxID=1891279 RepID=A0ABN5NG54_9PROT|nr:gamma-glutamyltransferase [Thalassospira indica]AXO15363.1 gamma-glutamyltranspeptidase [Thalassospira indica]OAZ12545.1 gamma-glutamyltranspeptidase [Thalassospira profundimaris]